LPVRVIVILLSHYIRHQYKDLDGTVSIHRSL